jgi:hypothetical protein
MEIRMDKNCWVLLSEDGDGYINSFEGIFDSKESALKEAKKLYKESIFAKFGEFFIKPSMGLKLGERELHEIPNCFDCGITNHDVKWEIRLVEIQGLNHG